MFIFFCGTSCSHNPVICYLAVAVVHGEWKSTSGHGRSDPRPAAVGPGNRARFIYGSHDVWPSGAIGACLKVQIRGSSTRWEISDNVGFLCLPRFALVALTNPRTEETIRQEGCAVRSVRVLAAPGAGHLPSAPRSSRVAWASPFFHAP